MATRQACCITSLDTTSQRRYPSYTTAQQTLTAKLSSQFDDHFERHLYSEVEADRLQGQSLDPKNALPLVLEHVGVDVGNIDRGAALPDELREPDAVACKNDIPRLLQRVVQLGRDVEGRQSDVLHRQLKGRNREEAARDRLTTNWNSA